MMVQRILFVLHNGPYTAWNSSLGGTEIHVQDLIANLKATHPETEAWSLIPNCNNYILSRHTGQSGSWLVPAGGKTLSQLLSKSCFSLVHLHHTFGFPLWDLKRALVAHGNLITSVHDFFCICQRFFLRSPAGIICDGYICEKSCARSPDDLDDHRAQHREIYDASRLAIYYAENTRKIISEVLSTTVKWKLILHGLSPEMLRDRGQSRPPAPSLDDEEIRVLFTGTIQEHKGLNAIRAMAQHSRLPSGQRLKWILLGSCDQEIENLQIIPRPARHLFLKQMEEIRPHISMLLSECVENYNLTIDELREGGAPVLSFPSGGLVARIKQESGARIIPQMSTPSAIDTLFYYLGNKTEYDRLQSEIAQYVPRDFRDVFGAYAEIYTDFSAPVKEQALQNLIKNLQPLESAPPRSAIQGSPHLSWRIRIENRLIKIFPLWAKMRAILRRIYRAARS